MGSSLSLWTFLLSILSFFVPWLLTVTHLGFCLCGFFHWTFLDFLSVVSRLSSTCHARMWIAMFVQLNFTQRRPDIISKGRRKQKLPFAHGMGRGQRVLWFFVLFDSTRGFPGEGPPNLQSWSIRSANVGSLQANKSWKTWINDVIAVQESRIGRNNVRSAKFDVESTGRELFHGELLPGLITSHGIKRTPLL